MTSIAHSWSYPCVCDLGPRCPIARTLVERSTAQTKGK